MSGTFHSQFRIQHCVRFRIKSPRTIPLSVEKWTFHFLITTSFELVFNFVIIFFSTIYYKHIAKQGITKSLFALLINFQWTCSNV